MKKHLLMILFTVAMIAVIVTCVYCARSNSVDSTIEFLINNTDIIELYTDEDVGIAYVFLPSYADLQNTTILIPDGMNISIDGVSIVSGADCSAFELNKEYRAEINGSTLNKILFLQSANVATMYVDTVFGDMEKVHRDKSYKEYAGIVLYTSDGKLDYQGDVTDRIRGHGNITTWNLDKKSYNLYLKNGENLLSMGKDDKYILLANITDNTNLRNKIVLDFAKKIRTYVGFTPDCEFVDLYLNKEYCGLYLLCTSSRSAVEEVGKDDILFFWDTELTKRTSRSVNNFEINTGISVEVKYPEKIKAEDRNYLRGLLTDMQNAMQDPNGFNVETGKYWYDYIDMDSWARKYLIEEIFMNYDAVAVSQYYFLKNSDHKIYAGYCWDYDNSLGLFVHTNPNCFLAQRLWKNENTYTPWYHFLWKQQEFREYVIALYNNEFLPKLQELCKTEIHDEIETVWTALQNNALKWYIKQVDTSIEAMTGFLDSRIEFLNSAWKDGIDYKTISLTGIDEYRFFCTPSGTVCENLPSPQDLGITDAFTWVYQDTGEVFDDNTVIREDITLFVEDADTDIDEERTETSIKVTVFSLILFLGMLVAAFIAELYSERSQR